MEIKKVIDTEKNFEQFLEFRNVGESSRVCYLRYYRHFQELISRAGFSQNTIEIWLIDKNNHQQIRAFVNNYLEFIKNKDIIIPRKTGTPSEKKHVLITEKQVILLVNHLLANKKYNYAVLFYLMSDTGLRRAEALGIKHSNFDWDSWNENKTKRCQLKILGKGKKERFVMVSPKVMRLIVYYVENCYSTSDKYFIRGNRNTMTKTLHEACETLFNRRFAPHDLRRYSANKWFSEGKILEQIQIRLGHKSVKTTELYVQPNIFNELKLWGKE